MIDKTRNEERDSKRGDEKIGEEDLIGKSVSRVESREKVTGTARYVHDMEVQGMLHTALVVSPHARARIKEIDIAGAEKLPGVRAVLTGRDVADYRVGLYLVDKTILAVDKVRYQGEPVAAVAAETESAARRARDLIRVEYEVLPAVLDIKEALADDAPLVHENLDDYDYLEGVFFPRPGSNIANHFKLRKGEAKKALSEADHLIENEFFLPRVSHVALETHTSIASWQSGDAIEIWTSAQSPYAVRNLLSNSFNIPHQQIKVKVPYVGGGFGGKAGIHFEPLVSLLSRAAGGQPVKYQASRQEEFNSVPVRQAMLARIRSGVNRDGRIVAQDIEFYWDSGAHADYGVNITRAAGYSAAGPYQVENVRVDSYTVYTNKIYGTAYRGFGHLEALWSVERQMDIIAAELGMDPREIRERNLLRPGSRTITGEKITENTGSVADCLQAVVEAIGGFGTDRDNMREADRADEEKAERMKAEEAVSGESRKAVDDVSGESRKVKDDMLGENRKSEDAVLDESRKVEDAVSDESIKTGGDGKAEDAVSDESMKVGDAGKADNSYRVRGKGVALLHKAPAMPSNTSTSAVIKFNENGSVDVSVSLIDYGQGTYTALAQLAADRLNLPLDKVNLVWENNTEVKPYDWQTVASKGLFMSGNAVLKACDDLIEQLKEVASQPLRASTEELSLGEECVYLKHDPDRRISYQELVMGYTYPDGSAVGGPLIGRGSYIAQRLTNLDPETGQGLPALNWTYGAHAAEIEVDKETGEIEIIRMASAFDVGRVINRGNVIGQIEGGVIQGLGSAIMEGHQFDAEGRLLTRNFTDYKIPTIRDIPELEPIVLENPQIDGPLGARGVAEHPMLSVPSVIGNALQDALGIEIKDLPLTPERILACLEEKGMGEE